MIWNCMFPHTKIKGKCAFKSNYPDIHISPNKHTHTNTRTFETVGGDVYVTAHSLGYFHADLSDVSSHDCLEIHARSVFQPYERQAKDINNFLRSTTHNRTIFWCGWELVRIFCNRVPRLLLSVDWVCLFWRHLVDLSIKPDVNWNQSLCSLDLGRRPWRLGPVKPNDDRSINCRKTYVLV